MRKIFLRRRVRVSSVRVLIPAFFLVPLWNGILREPSYEVALIFSLMVVVLHACLNFPTSLGEVQLRLLLFSSKESRIH